MADMGFKYTVNEVIKGCREMSLNIARSKKFANSEYALTYLGTMEQSYFEYGIKGMQTQALYIVGNLSAWRGVEGRIARGWLRDIAKPGVIVPNPNN